MSSAADGRQMCKYGKECYQKNPMHGEKFKHPSDDDKEEKKAAEVEEEQKQQQNGAKRKLVEEEEKGEPNKKAAKVDDKENAEPKDQGGDSIRLKKGLKRSPFAQNIFMSSWNWVELQ